MRDDAALLVVSQFPSSPMAMGSHQTVYCDDPYHAHKNPMVDEYAIQFRGHQIDIARADGLWTVRIDNGAQAVNLSYDAMSDFVQRHTKG